MNKKTQTKAKKKRQKRLLFSYFMSKLNWLHDKKSIEKLNNATTNRTCSYCFYFKNNSTGTFTNDIS